MNRINLVCLGVKDMAKSLAFYKSIGFQTYEKEERPPVVFFDNQGTKLELFQLEGLVRDINEDNPPAPNSVGFPGFTLACNMESEAEVDAAINLVREQGGEIVKEPRRVFWGGYSGYFRDPDGYYWEVAYGPMFAYDENGMLIIEPKD